MIYSIPHKSFTFPTGERHVRLLDPIPQRGTEVNVTWKFVDSSDVMELLLFCDAVQRAGLILNRLEIPYFPFSRQDRVCSPGDPVSVAVMAHLINGLHAKTVEVTDPHSDVCITLLDRCEVNEQWEVFAGHLRELDDFYLISPDAGAEKKIAKLLPYCRPIELVYASKARDPETGTLTGIRVPREAFNGKTCVIVDDICDGGGTFVQLGIILKGRGAGKVVLMVTHGFFTKGLSVFDGLIDEIYTREGRVK